MKTLVVGIIVLTSVSIGAYAVSRNQNLKISGNASRITNKFQRILRILVDLSTVISMLLVFFTLQEMQKERDNAYRPNIVADETSVEIQLNEYVSKGDNTPQIILELYNIGVGSAEQLSIAIEEDSYADLCKYLGTISDGEANSYSINQTNFVTEYSDGTAKMTPRDFHELNISFVLPNAQKKIDYVLPEDLIEIVTDIEVCRSKGIDEAMLGKKDGERTHIESISIPVVKLNVSFQDIQGKEYEETITLKFIQSVIQTGKSGITHEKIIIRPY